MKIKIGTRKSRLALVQTQMVVESIHNEYPDIETEIVHITTQGDKILDKPLSEFGGKGVFVSEIERSLIDGDIDIAVHSAKDLPVKLGEGLEISAVLEREDYRDVLATRIGTSFKSEDSFIAGTSSMRRILNMKRAYPNAVCKDIRGNIETRLEKLKSGGYDAVILAAAAIKRLKLSDSDEFWFTLHDKDEFVPAACQGIIAVESRKNSAVSEIMSKITDEVTMRCFETEHYVKELLGGDCSSPICALAEEDEGKTHLYISTDCQHVLCGVIEIEKRIELAGELVRKLK